MTDGQRKIEQWFKSRRWKPFEWQRTVWKHCLDQKKGLLNAPTGSGKTFALFMPLLIEWINQNPNSYQEKENNGLRLLWITPLRALAKDLEQNMQEVVSDLDISWQVQRRTGDVSSSVKQKQKRQMPEVLITTPESLHILLAQKGYPKRFKNLKSVVIDECMSHFVPNVESRLNSVFPG